MKPSETTALQLLAFVLMQNARPAKAMVLLDAIDAVRPDQPEVLRALALAQVRAGKPARALRTLDRIAALGATAAAQHLLRAQALGALGRPLEAAQSMAAFVRTRQAAPAPAVPPRADAPRQARP